MADQELILPVTEEEYETAGSKFVTMPAGAKVGDSVYLDVEVGMPGWDTPGKSVKFPVRVSEEGPDAGKEDNISTGVDTKSIWKLKEIHRAVIGGDLEMKKGADGKMHPVLKPTIYAGKPAVAQYTLIEGENQTTHQKTIYPKLISLMAAGEKPKASGIL